MLAVDHRDPATPCPCGLPATYDTCCGRWHRGGDAPTAELLMRSRYTAFALGHTAHLLRTWAPATRPRRLLLDDDRTWTRLLVLATERGGMLDTEGVVEFRASYDAPSGPGVQTERSRFVRDAGRWAYLDAV